MKKWMNVGQWLSVIGLWAVVNAVSAQSPQPVLPNATDLFEQHPVVMLVIDPESGRIEAANQAARDFYGYGHDVFLQKTIQQINLFTPTQVKQERQAAALQARDYFLFRHRLASGAVKRVQVYSRPYETLRGQKLLSMIWPLAALAKQEDIVNQYQTQLEAQVDAQIQALEHSKTNQAWWLSALIGVLALALIGQSWFWRREKRERHRNQELLQTFFKQSPTAIYVHDATTGALVDANEQAWRMYGLDSLAALQQADLFGEPPFSRADAFKWIQRTVHHGPQQFAWQTQTEQGTHWEWMQLTKTTLDGQPRVIATGMDITVLKHAQAQLDELNRKFVTFLENTTDFVFFKDDAHRFEFSSQTVADINGFASWRDLIGKTTLEVFPETMAMRYHKDEKWVYEHRRPLLDKEAPYLRVDGTKGWVQASKWPVFAPDSDKVVGLFGINRDITARVEMEEALKQAKDRAEAANEAKSQFLANMSHELRTPMNGIIGMSELGPYETQPEKLQPMMRQINQSARLLLRQLDDVLDWVQLESGQFDIVPKPFYLNSLLDNLRELYQSKAQQKNVAFVVENDALSGACYVGDLERVAQVLTHLLSNAFKFTFQGSVCLAASHTQFDERTWLRLAVKDTGQGSDDTQKAHLFESFRVGDDSNTRAHGGMGLGLAMAKKIVQYMGGTLTLDSHPGAGTEVVVHLPLPPCDRAQEASLVDQYVPGDYAPSQQCVLIVEDNQVNQKVVASFVKRMGLCYETADNGEEAVAMSQEKAYDLVLMDIQMPGMDGYEATRRIRQRHPDVPVIAVTAAAMIEDERKSLAAGMNEHLSKPLMWDSFTQAVNRWLQLPDKPEIHAMDQARSEAQPQTETVHEHHRPSVMVVDDAKTNIKVLANALKHDYKVQVADSGERALAVLAQQSLPDLILLDIMMPNMDGYEVCRLIKNDPKTQAIPVIFVTALDSEMDEAKGFEVGAVDFITKPFKVPVVQARVKNHIKLKKRTDMLEQMSHIDGLTQIPNRRQLDETLETELKRLQRDQAPLGVVMIDIDFFKAFNDHYGHGRGDDALERVAQALQDCLQRPGDFVARYGGEEFVVLLPETDLAGTRKVVAHMAAAVDAARIEHAYSSVSDFVSISLGAVSGVPVTALSAQDWLEQADQALYQAKKHGRHQGVVLDVEG